MERAGPGHFAVIFISRLGEDTEGYQETARRMLELASAQPGFLGLESAREEAGITVSFWKDRESIRQWRDQVEHRIAQRMGREKWYRSYEIHIARIEESRRFS